METFRRLFLGCMTVPETAKKESDHNDERFTVWNVDDSNSMTSIRLKDSADLTPDSKTAEPAVHLTLVLDSSKDMAGRPAVAVAKGIQFLLRFMQPNDILTVWHFDEQGTSRPIHGEAQHFPGQLRQPKKMGSPPSRDTVALFESIVAVVEDLESQGERPLVVKPLLVLTDYHQSYGAAEAFEAKNALLWCEVPHVYPILMSAGDPDVFDGVRQTKTREVFVDSTADEDLHSAFQVAGEHLQAILKQAVEDVEL